TGVLSSFLEQSLCSFWEGTSQRGVTSFAQDELVVVGCWSFAVQSEWVLAFSLQRWVEAEQVPVTAINSTFHLVLAVGHAALDGVHLTWSIADNQRWTWICFSFSQSFDGLVHVSAHCDLSNIDVTVGHSDFSKALLSDCFTSCSKLCNLTNLRSLGSLTTGVG